jgi:hypothetical protein
MVGIIEAIENNRGSSVEMYKGIIETLERNDWDCHYEVLGMSEACDMAMAQLHPEWMEED